MFIHPTLGQLATPIHDLFYEELPKISLRTKIRKGVLNLKSSLIRTFTYHKIFRLEDTELKKMTF